RPEVDLEAVRAGGGFLGTLLEEAQALSHDDAALAALWDDEDLTTLGQRLKRLGVDALEAPRPELVTQAGQRGVEQLHEEAS
ncbi:DNA repair exonuclease, partial [Corallococcus sp. 4LFB]